MKKQSFALAFLAGVSLLGMTLALASPAQAKAMDDFVTADGTTQYGWGIIANETNKTIWDFGADGMPAKCRAAEGDTSEQRVYDYAIRNLAVKQDDAYSLSCTFTPDADSDLSAERTYGLVCWYQDADNYLIYWLQQKTSADWSGQFYGRVAGAFRKMYFPQSQASGGLEYADYWRKGEYYDMWWDQANDTNANLYNQRSILLTKTVTLKVVSAIEDVTVNGEVAHCRKFDLHQIVDGSDKLVRSMYVQQINATTGDFYTGLYSEAFSVGLSDYVLAPTNTNFGEHVASLIDALPSAVSSKEDIAAIIAARNAYKGLLSFKSQLSNEELTKLEGSEAKAAAYVDTVISALDDKKSSFKEDVNAAYELYASCNAEIQAKITKLSELTNAIQEAKTWTDPNTSSAASSTAASSETPSSSSLVSTSSTTTPTPNPSGVNGGAIAGIVIGSIVVVAGVVVAVILVKKHKKVE